MSYQRTGKSLQQLIDAEKERKREAENFKIESKKRHDKEFRANLEMINACYKQTKRTLLEKIFRLSNKYGACYQGQTRLAKECGVTRQAIQWCLNELEADRVLSIERYAGPHGENVYCINWSVLYRKYERVLERLKEKAARCTNAKQDKFERTKAVIAEMTFSSQGTPCKVPLPKSEPSEGAKIPQQPILELQHTKEVASHTMPKNAVSEDAKNSHSSFQNESCPAKTSASTMPKDSSQGCQNFEEGGAKYAWHKLIKATEEEQLTTAAVFARANTTAAENQATLSKPTPTPKPQEESKKVVMVPAKKVVVPKEPIRKLTREEFDQLDIEEQMLAAIQHRMPEPDIQGLISLSDGSPARPVCAGAIALSGGVPEYPETLSEAPERFSYGN